MSNTLKFAVVSIVVGLHTLRNLSMPLAMLLYAPVAAYVYIQFISTKVARREPDGRWGLFAGYLAIVAAGTAVSIATISTAGAAYGLVRLVYALPVFCAFYLYTDSSRQLQKNMTVMVVFFAAASLTIPMQEITGPIHWFAPATERAGFDRYASLIGSLTSVGIAVGSYVVLTQALSRRTQPLWILALAVPSVISLSKSAIANIAIALAILLIMNRKHLSKTVIVGSALLAALAIAYSFVPYIEERVDAVLVSFGVSQANVVNYDVSFGESMSSRVLELPAANFAALGDIGSPLVYLVGGGFGMASTALVPADDSLAQMAHNQFAENMSVFGLLFGGLFNLIMIVVLVRLVQFARKGLEVAGVVAGAYVILLVNSVFANGVTYQPATASVFFLALFVATCGERFLEERREASLLADGAGRVSRNRSEQMGTSTA